MARFLLFVRESNPGNIAISLLQGNGLVIARFYGTLVLDLIGRTEREAFLLSAIKITNVAILQYSIEKQRNKR